MNHKHSSPWIPHRQDFMASLVVFLVALPLSLGIALASGVKPEAGIIAAVCGGIIAGLMGGAPLQASGPAAGLTVMVFSLVQEFGFPVTCTITIAAGLLQILLGTLKVGRITLAISPPIVHGMLAGIGILISLGQIHVLLGHHPAGSGVANLVAIPQSFIQASIPSLLIGLLTLSILFGWRYTQAKKLKFLPPSLVAIIVATFVAEFFNLSIARVDLNSDLIHNISLPILPSSSYSTFIAAAFSMTFIASAESLLCAVATDSLHSGPRANLNKELIGQGFANTLSGFLGGLPVTGVIVRSAANIASGAKTKWSAILHGFWILIFVTQFSSIVNLVPLSALAGLLVYVGVNLIKPADIEHLSHYKEAWIYGVTVLGVVFINLLAGIGIGAACTLLILLLDLSKLKIKQEMSGSTLKLHIKGALTFLAVPRLSSALSDITLGKHIELQFDVSHLDAAGIDCVRSWKTGYERTGGSVKKPDLDSIWGSLRTERKKIA